MFDFGDELILGNYRIPWLIWIQLLVTFLLIVLLYYFSFIALDLSDITTTTSSIASPSTTTTTTTHGGLFLPDKNSHVSKRSNNPTSITTTSTTSNLHQVGESQSIRGEVAPSTSRRAVRGLDIREREDLSTKNETHFAVSENSYHPCYYYFELAKQAFLKCFGLDFNSESSTRAQNKED